MKTTKAHFELFKKECQKWIDIFELSNWSVRYVHGGLSDDAFAHTNRDLKAYNATISFTDNWGDTKFNKLNKEEISELAKHGVLHLLFARFSMNANSRFIGYDDLVEAEHEIIQKLIKIIV